MLCSCARMSMGAPVATLTESCFGWTVVAFLQQPAVVCQAVSCMLVQSRLLTDSSWRYCIYQRSGSNFVVEGTEFLPLMSRSCCAVVR